MAGKSNQPNKKPRSRQGLLPNQYRKESTVKVERLRGVDEPARYSGEDTHTTDYYIVITDRTDGRWSHTVELKGEVYRLPGAVVDRIIRHREAIIKEQRSERGKEQAAARLSQTAQGDVEDAAAGVERL